MIYGAGQAATTSPSLDFDVETREHEIYFENDDSPLVSQSYN